MARIVAGGTLRPALQTPEDTRDVFLGGMTPAAPEVETAVGDLQLGSDIVLKKGNDPLGALVASTSLRHAVILGYLPLIGCLFYCS
jgi:hypothetical protein